jgi:hypothetical protein
MTLFSKLKWSNAICVCFLLSTTVLSGCNDDEDSLKSTNASDIDDFSESDSIAYISLRARIYNASDSLHTSISVGENLDPSQPTIYYMGVPNTDAAVSWFTRTCKITSRRDTLADGTITYDLGSFGLLKFSCIDDSETFATLEFNLSYDPNITQLKFIPESMWPNNEATPFNLGDIVVDNTKKWKWVCVQELGAASPITFITFDADPGYNSYGVPSHFSQECATEEAFQAWYALVTSGAPLFKSNNATLKSISDNMYVAAGLINGQFDMPDLLYYCGLVYKVWYEDDEKDNYRDGGSCLRVFAPMKTVNYPAGEIFDFYCLNEWSGAWFTNSYNSYKYKYNFSALFMSSLSGDGVRHWGYIVYNGKTIKFPEGSEQPYLLLNYATTSESYYRAETARKRFTKLNP